MNKMIMIVSLAAWFAGQVYADTAAESLAETAAATTAGQSANVADAATPLLSLAKTNYQAADIDNDGALSKNEFEQFVNINADAKLGKASNIRRFKVYDRAFTKIDANENNQVSWQEFVAAQAK